MDYSNPETPVSKQSGLPVSHPRSGEPSSNRSLTRTFLRGASSLTKFASSLIQTPQTPSSGSSSTIEGNLPDPLINPGDLEAQYQQYPANTDKNMEESLESQIDIDDPSLGNPNSSGPNGGPERKKDATDEDPSKKDNSYTHHHLEVLPHPESLLLPDEIKARLVYETLIYHLGYIEPASLLSCGIRVLQTQVQDVKFSPFCQYMIRVLSVYYSNVPMPDNISGFFDIAHYCHSRGTLQDDDTSDQLEGPRVLIMFYGINELIIKLAQALIAPAYLEESRDSFQINTEYGMLLMNEIQSMYADLLVIVKMACYIMANNTELLEPHLEVVRYNADYDAYLDECCIGESLLDLVNVDIAPKMYTPPVPKPVDQGDTPREAPTVHPTSAPNHQSSDRRRPSVVLKTAYDRQSDDLTNKLKEKIVYDQADLGTTRIIRDTTLFRQGIDDLTFIRKWIDEAEEMFDRVEKKMNDIIDFVTKLDAKVDNLDAGLASLHTTVHAKTLAGQQQINEAVLGVQGQTDQGNSLSIKRTEIKTKVNPTDQEGLTNYHSDRDQVVKSLRNYDKVKDKNELATQIFAVFKKAGRSDLSMNVTAKVLERSMTRNRIIQSLIML